MPPTLKVTHVPDNAEKCLFRPFMFKARDVNKNISLELNNQEFKVQDVYVIADSNNPVNTLAKLITFDPSVEIQREYEVSINGTLIPIQSWDMFPPNEKGEIQIGLVLLVNFVSGGDWFRP